MNSLTPTYFGSLTYTNLQVRTIGALNVHKGRQTLYFVQKKNTVQTLQEHAKIASVLSSNRIEDIHIDESRADDIILRQGIPRDRSEQEVAGYRDVLALIHDSYEHMDVTPRIILQCHQLLFRYHPSPGGHYKSQDNAITQTQGEVTTVRFEPTSALATPSQMDGMCRRYNALVQEGEDPFVLIALFLLDFLCIHPFPDGNGRVSRLLCTLLLQRQSIMLGKYVSLESLIERRKNEYYEALHQSSQRWHDGQHDVRPWLEFFWSILLEGFRQFEHDIEQLSGSASKTQLVRAAVLATQSPFRLADLQKKLPHVSRSTISKVLKQMKQEELLRMEGQARGSRWFLI